MIDSRLLVVCAHFVLFFQNPVSLSNDAGKNMHWLSLLVVRCVQDRDNHVHNIPLPWNATNPNIFNLGDALKQISSSEVVFPLRLFLLSSNSSYCYYQCSSRKVMLVLGHYPIVIWRFFWRSGNIVLKLVLTVPLWQHLPRWNCNWIVTSTEESIRKTDLLLIRAQM